MVAVKIIGIGVSLVAVIIAIIIFAKFAQTLNLGKGLSDAGKGIQDFFSDIGESLSTLGGGSDDNVVRKEDDPTVGGRTTVTTTNPDGSETVKVEGTTLTILKEKLTDQELEKLRSEADFSFDEAIKALDPNDPDFQQKALALAEAEGITGVDEITINEAGGISIKQFDKPRDDSKDFSFDIIPKAFAEESDTSVISDTQVKDERELGRPDVVKEGGGGFKGKSERFSDQQLKDIQNLRTNKGLNLIDFTKTGNRFEVFQSEGSKGFVGAIIRPTPIDRTKLMEGETASERANRVFEETGDFVDVKRGATSVKDREPFDFGTNTGSGQKGGTEADTKKSLQQRLAEEAEKARLIFDSSTITRF